MGAWAFASWALRHRTGPGRELIRRSNRVLYAGAQGPSARTCVRLAHGSATRRAVRRPSGLRHPSTHPHPIRRLRAGGRGRSRRATALGACANRIRTGGRTRELGLGRRIADICSKPSLAAVRVAVSRALPARSRDGMTASGKVPPIAPVPPCRMAPRSTGGGSSSADGDRQRLVRAMRDVETLVTAHTQVEGSRQRHSEHPHGTGAPRALQPT